MRIQDLLPVGGNNVSNINDMPDGQIDLHREIHRSTAAHALVKTAGTMVRTYVGMAMTSYVCMHVCKINSIRALQSAVLV